MENKRGLNYHDLRELRKILNNSEMASTTPECLNIAIIGKSGSGKSTFLNAFRGISKNDPKKAKVGPNLTGTSIELKNAKYLHKVQKDNKEFKINFFDTMGFYDIENTDSEKFLRDLRNNNNIKEFDAIIFLTKDKFSANEVKIAQLNEKKNVMIFFVFNKLDMLFDQILSSEDLKDHGKSQMDQLRENKKILDKKLKDHRENLTNLIKEHRVFDSLLSEIEKFSSENLKDELYKTKLIQKSVYYISSSPSSIFEDEFFSIDGNRLKTEIEKHLVLIKFNNFSINLLEQFSIRTIYLKKKSILDSLFNTKKLSIAIAATSSVVPFLELLPTSMIKTSYKQEFFEKFGMKHLKDILKGNPDLISREKIMNIEAIFERIAHDKIIKNLDSLTINSNANDIDIVRNHISNLIYEILPALGLNAPRLFLRLSSFIPEIATLPLKITTKCLIASLSLLTVPITIAIYLHLLKRGIEEILLKYEEYALLLFEVIHN